MHGVVSKAKFAKNTFAIELKKISNFKILFHYLKDEKLKLFIYVILVLLTYLPSLLTRLLYYKIIYLKRLSVSVKYSLPSAIVARLKNG